MKLVAKGAEANLYVADGKLIKYRIKKGYRDETLDARLRLLRTRRESKLLRNAKKAGVGAPEVFETDLEGSRICMEYLDAVPVKDFLESASEKDVKDLAGKIGTAVALLHNADIIHNDLTTSNMLLSGEGLFLIDFGLGMTSTRVEDKAMDIVVLKKSLKVAHTDRFQTLWDSIIDAYGGLKQREDILSRMKEIERRARYSVG